MAEIIIFLFAFFSPTLAGLTSPRVVTSAEVTPSCQVLQSKQEFGNLTVSRVFVSGKLYLRCLTRGLGKPTRCKANYVLILR